jgi:hypothetical protein
MHKPEAKFKAGDYVQRVNQPELAGIVRELRWDAQSKAGIILSNSRHNYALCSATGHPVGIA